MVDFEQKNIERNKYLKIPSSALLPLFIVGFFGIQGLNDFAELGATVVTKGLDQVLSNPEIGSKALFEVIWGSGELVISGILYNLFRTPLSKIRFE